MGGRVGFGMAKHAPGRLLSLMIGGIPPYRNVERHKQFIAFLAQGIDAFAAVWETQATLSLR